MDTGLSANAWGWRSSLVVVGGPYCPPANPDSPGSAGELREFLDQWPVTRYWVPGTWYW